MLLKLSDQGATSSQVEGRVSLTCVGRKGIVHHRVVSNSVTYLNTEGVLRGNTASLSKCLCPSSWCGSQEMLVAPSPYSSLHGRWGQKSRFLWTLKELEGDRRGSPHCYYSLHWGEGNCAYWWEQPCPLDRGGHYAPCQTLSKSKTRLFPRPAVSIETFICWDIFRFGLGRGSIYFFSILVHVNDWHSLLAGLLFSLEAGLHLHPSIFFLVQARVAPVIKMHSQTSASHKRDGFWC